MDYSRTIPTLLAELAAAYQHRRTLEDSADEEHTPDDRLGLEQKMLSLLLDLLPVGVSILDGNRKVVFQNLALLKILDMNAEGIQAGAYQQRKYLAADGTPLDFDGFASVRAERSGQAVHNVETGIIKENGEVVWVNVSAVPLDFPDWKMVVVTSDITERKRLDLSLRESEQRYTLLFQKSTIPAMLLKLPEVTIADVNEAAEGLTGFTRQEMLGKTAAELGIISHDQRTEAIRRFEEQGALAENERYIFNKAGEARIVVSRTNPVDLGGQRYAITTLEDVTERRQAQEKLQESDEFLRLAYEAADLGVWKNDLQTGAVEFDERARIHYGFDTLHTTITEVMNRLHPDDLARLGAEIAAATAPTGTGKFATEYRVTHPNGSVRWLAIGVRVTFEGEAEQRHAVMGYGTSLDITERKQAEENLRQRKEELEQLLDLLPDAVWIAEDPACQIIRGNRFANDLLGTTKDDNISQSAEAPAVVLRQFSQGRELAPDELPMQMAAKTGQPQMDFELRIEHPSKPARTLLGGAIPLFDVNGKPRGAVASFHDITERKHMEDELRRSNAELEQFAYVASHDLQEPLRAMAGMVQLLQQRYRGQLDERADQYIDLAVEASTRMQALINDLLTFSRVDRRGKPFEAVPLQTSVETALKNLAVAVHESGAQVTWEALPTVRADGGQMVQLLQNLIGNAIKFRGEREPRVHIRAGQVEAGWQVSVQDNGIGIEPQYFERIFQVFQRLHTRAEYPGTGIGLALCKKIVERHGGSLWVESTPGVGSTFHFTIPNRRKNDVSNPRP